MFTSSSGNDSSVPVESVDLPYPVGHRGSTKFSLVTAQRNSI